MEYPQTYTYTSTNPSPKFLILGAIHGTEPCGPLAIQKLIQQLDDNTISLIQGTLTLIPICNPKAFANQQKYYEKNLNRVFKPGYDNTSYEGKLATHIRTYIDDCDYLLDIHSLSGGDKPFLFKSSQTDPGVDDFAKATNIDQVIDGRSELYDSKGEWATDQYAGHIGKKGLCIECGQHNDPASITVAYNTILHCLRHLGMIAGPATYTQNQKTYTMQHIFYKTDEGKWTKDRKHADNIRQGEIIAIRENGEHIIAQRDGVILLPKPQAKLGDERFYLGQITA